MLEPGPALRRLTSVERVEHAKTSLVMIRTRLAPPWINTSIVLEGEAETSIATTWALIVVRLLLS